MHGVLRRMTPPRVGRVPPNGDDESYDDHGTTHSSNTAEMPHQKSQKPYITNIGKKFACGEIHRHIRRIFDQFFDGAWPTYRRVPKDVRSEMFDCFRGHYRWHPSNEGRIERSFHRVLKDRYPDILKELRKQSAARARANGHTIPDTDDDFHIMRDHPPWSIDDCYWDTPAWKKKSAAGRANRISGDGGGKPRHTGGSMGYDEHRVRLEKKLKRPIRFIELFLHTHLSKDSKKRFWAGDYETIEGLEFCTSTSREAYEAYARAMLERFGEDQTQHPVGDVDVWVDSQRGRGSRSSRIYGIGCSDLHFIITGTSSSGNTSSSAEHSQQRVRELEERQAQVEAQMVERQSQYEAQLQAQLAENREQLQAQLKAQMEEFMKNYGNGPNNPP